MFRTFSKLSLIALMPLLLLWAAPCAPAAESSAPKESAAATASQQAPAAAPAAPGPPVATPSPAAPPAAPAPAPSGEVVQPPEAEAEPAPEEAEPLERPEAPPQPALSLDQIEALKKTLEDPAAREQLIRQLDALAKLQSPEEDQNKIQGALEQVMRGLSRRLETFSEGLMELAGGINALPKTLEWIEQQYTTPQKQDLWKEVMANIALVMGSAMAAYLLLGRMLARVRNRFIEEAAEGRRPAALRLLGLLALELLPLAAFAGSAYLLLGMLSPREKTRLITLVWINAFLIVHSVEALSRFILAPQTDHLRLPLLTGETANYLDIWVGRLSRTAIYGYFSLEAGRFLGLPKSVHELLMRGVGLAVAVLSLIFIWQNRSSAADLIRGWGEKNTAGPRSKKKILRRFARIWHLIASAYVIILFAVWGLKVEGGFYYLLRATTLTLVALALGWAGLHLIHTLLSRGIDIGDKLKSRFPGLEERANRYLSTLETSLRLFVEVLVFLAVLQAWGMNSFHWVISEPGKVLGGTIIRIATILGGSFAVWEIANILIQKSLSGTNGKGGVNAPSGRTKTLLTITRKALLMLLSIFGTLMVLSELGLDIAPLLAGAGVLGLAVGFGSQKLVQDVITGIFILLEDQISVGDVIRTADHSGQVEAVSIRTVRLRDVTGTVHTIPYSAISTVSNLTRDFSYYVLNVGVAYSENVDEVMDELKNLGEALRQDTEFGPSILEPIEVMGVDTLADSAVIIKARIKTVPNQQWWIGREFNRRMKNRFDELGIEIPFPHTKVYFGQDHKGGAALGPPVLAPREKSAPEDPGA